MIRGYSDHAANERTFLAWVRTGIAVIAFGFVIEKFNLFMRSLASMASDKGALAVPIGRISGPLGRDEGIALIIGGAVLIALATFRFVRTARLLDDAETHAASSVRTELVFSSVLLLVLPGSASSYCSADREGPMPSERSRPGRRSITMRGRTAAPHCTCGPRSSGKSAWRRRRWRTIGGRCRCI